MPDQARSRRAALARGRDVVLDEALRKRSAGVPTFSVPEAAALLSVSREYLYKLVRAGAFPVLRMGLLGGHGRYVVPAQAVEQMLAAAADGTAEVGGER